MKCYVCSAIPPHILDKLSQHSDNDIKQRALDTMKLSAQLLGRREVMGKLPAFATALGVKMRSVYDAKNTSRIPGFRVRFEGDPPSGDTAVDEAYEGAGATFDFYKEVFERTSLDNHGMQLDSTVHYQVGYDNAFFDGSGMRYGDGDGRIFVSFTKALDVIVHEFTHGVTQFTANLAYQDQSGALNESMSDCFGSMAKQRVLKQDVTQADWLIGSGILAPGVKGVALRSMLSPGTAYDDPILGRDPQPAQMSDYQQMTQDNGGVHINSGIPNYAFARSCVERGGFSWDTIGKVWYKTLTERLTPDSDFAHGMQATIQAASELFGNGSLEMKAVQTGWKAAGFSVQ